MAVCANNVFITPKARVMTSAINMEPTREPAHPPATPRSVKYEPTHPTAYRRNAIPNTSWNRHNRPGPITSGLSNAPPREMKRTVQTAYAPLSPRLRYIQRSAKATVAKTHRLARQNPKLPINMERPNEGIELRAPFCRILAITRSEVSPNMSKEKPSLALPGLRYSFGFSLAPLNSAFQLHCRPRSAFGLQRSSNS